MAIGWHTRRSRRRRAANRRLRGSTIAYGKEQGVPGRQIIEQSVAPLGTDCTESLRAAAAQSRNNEEEPYNDKEIQNNESDAPSNECLVVRSCHSLGDLRVISIPFRISYSRQSPASASLFGGEGSVGAEAARSATTSNARTSIVTPHRCFPFAFRRVRRVIGWAVESALNIPTPRPPIPVVGSLTPTVPGAEPR